MGGVQLNEYVVSVGAGKNQLPLIKELINRNFKVISFDKNESAIGKKYSYRFNNISTWDYENAIKWLESQQLQYSGILCFSYGKAIITQQQLIKHFNLNCEINEDFLSIMEDKHKLRKILYKYGMSCIKEDYLANVNNVLIEGKYIIKDKFGDSSKNIFLISKNELKTFVKNNMFIKDFIVQEFVEGIDYRIISIIQDNKVRFFSLLERESLLNTFFTSRLIPINKFDVNFYDIVNDLNNILKIKDGLLKVDLVDDGSKKEILEIDFGIGGDYFETVISPKCYNYNYIDNYINLMLGLPVKEKKVPDNELYFDYVYNINKSKNLIMDYDKIFYVANKYFQDYEIIKIKKQDDKVKYPTSNMDAAFGIIHNNKNMTNYDINILFNEALLNEVL